MEWNECHINKILLYIEGYEQGQIVAQLPGKKNQNILTMSSAAWYFLQLATDLDSFYMIARN